jgi:hypothetical protein
LRFKDGEKNSKDGKLDKMISSLNEKQLEYLG